MKRFTSKVLLFIFIILNAIACTETPEYEEIAIKYQEARYKGDIETQKALSTPESDPILDLFQSIYKQDPYLKEINENASCTVMKSELSDDASLAFVTIEENNVHTGNLLSQHTQKQIETQETVIELKKINNKWLVVVKY